MAIDTVSNFLARYGEGSLHTLRDMLERGERYQVIADQFGVTHVAVVKWRRKFFVDRVLFNRDTEMCLSYRNSVDLERDLQERRNIRENTLRLIQGGQRRA